MKNITQQQAEQIDIKDRIFKVELSLKNLKDNNSLLLDLLPLDISLAIKCFCEKILNEDLDYSKQTDVEITLWIDGLVDNLNFIHEQQQEDRDIKNYEIKLKDVLD